MFILNSRRSLLSSHILFTHALVLNPAIAADHVKELHENADRPLLSSHRDPIGNEAAYQVDSTHELIVFHNCIRLFHFDLFFFSSLDHL